MKANFRNFALALCAVAVVGCAKPDPLIGTWTGQIQTMEFTMNFKADKTYEMGMSNAAQKVKITLNGDYKREGDKLTMTPRGVKTEGMPAELKSMVEEQMKKDTGKSQTGTIKFKNDDEVEISGFGQGGSNAALNTATLKRKK